jgi:hypothetical protein
VADTDPMDPNSLLRVSIAFKGSLPIVTFPSSTNRVYTLQFSESLGPKGWANETNQVEINGNGGKLGLEGHSAKISTYYRVEVKLPANP